MSTISSACCSIPPVVIENYQPRGSYTTFSGMKTYMTGPADAKKAILFIGDIFGFSTQTLQGADLLSRNEYLVLYPDFFDGQPAQASWMVGDFDGVPPKIMEFIMTAGNPSTALSRIPALLSVITTEKDVEEWGAVGLCWGGKIVSLYCGIDSGEKIKVAAQAHPAMLDPADALKIAVPFATLASDDENEEDVRKFVEGLKGEKISERFEGMRHGWMAARGDLSDDKGREEYARGYNILGEWFEKYL